MTMMQINHLDHLVLTVQDIQITTEFYTQVLGMEKVTYGENRHALLFGQQKINLHQQGKEFEPKAQSPTPGSADLCFITTTPLSDVIEHLQRCHVRLLSDPIQRTGALGSLLSIYIRDPDGNLLEISNQLD